MPKRDKALKNFSKPLPQKLLNIEEKNRSNLFTWRGQFSPQLIECLLDAYCLDASTLLDPFAGSGTVLYEAAAAGLPVYGFEINPSAWSFSKIYEFANLSKDARNAPVKELRRQIENAFAIKLFSDGPVSNDILEEKITYIGNSISNHAKILCNALVVLLDIHRNSITNNFVQSKFTALTEMVRHLPYSAQAIKADLQDARSLPLRDGEVDFAITSPPYINVFNYHQNYRRSAELLGWDLLRVARSEIGSNRANRGNRFYTVIQYCIDMTTALQELARVLKPDGRAIIIVGYESQVLGTPFYNADLIERIATELKIFEVVLRQKRIFMNRFGNAIREDILNFVRTDWSANSTLSYDVGRRVALETLAAVSPGVPEKSRPLLSEAVRRVGEVDGTPIFNTLSYREYQTRDCVMMVKEKGDSSVNENLTRLPTPHLHKLTTLLQNPRLPDADRPRVEEALSRYQKWTRDMEAITPGQKNTVQQLVNMTNRYKRFIELNLIFDSPENFLYRQKGQLKLDNTILEEFLPQLCFRGLRSMSNLEFGPHKTFAGLSFTSSLAHPGIGGQPNLRTKDQDFILGKRLYMMTSFDKEFHQAERVESYLGYVCVECKTNLDKTMFQEAVATSRDLKIAVPSSLYFLVCEFLDMTPASITPTYIDDVLIVRKAKRMPSNTRQEYRSASARRRHRQEYVNFIDSARYHADVFQRMIDKIQRMMDDTAPENDTVPAQGYF